MNIDIPQQAHDLHKRITEHTNTLLARIHFYELARQRLPLTPQRHQQLWHEGRAPSQGDLGALVIHRRLLVVIGRIGTLTWGNENRVSAARVQLITPSTQQTALNSLQKLRDRSGILTGWPVTTDEIQTEADQARATRQEWVATQGIGPDLMDWAGYMWDEVWVRRLAQAEVARHHYAHQPHLALLRLTDRRWNADDFRVLDRQALERCGLSDLA